MEQTSGATKPALLEMFLSFLRLGLTAFGGPSMVAYIRRLSVDQKGWLTSEAFNLGTALCQAIPGATAMQTTAYVGLVTRGVPGAAVCFIGFGLPAFLLMMAFSAIYSNVHDFPAVVSAFSGLQAIIVALVANAALSFGKTTLKNLKELIIAGGAALLFGLNVHPAIIILTAALAGLVLLRIEARLPSSQSAPQNVQPTTRPFLGILFAAAVIFLLLFLFQRAWFNLAALFFRIDLLAFGGGFASIPIMFHEVVDLRHWMDSATFLNGIALGQVTPGPIVITATFIGYILYGLTGAILATASIFLPSFTLVVGITPYFRQMQASVAFNQAISGVLCSFVGLLLTVALRFGLNVHWSLSHVLLAIAAFIALYMKVDILWVVLAGTFLSILFIH